MSNGTPREDKNCACCGIRMISREYNDSRRVWSARRFCCNECRFEHDRARRKRIRVGLHPRKPPVDIMSAEKRACIEHLKLLLSYGLKHDGLPGLPANDLLRLAQEHGVAA